MVPGRGGVVVQTLGAGRRAGLVVAAAAVPVALRGGRRAADHGHRAGHRPAAQALAEQDPGSATCWRSACSRPACNGCRPPGPGCSICTGARMTSTDAVPVPVEPMLPVPYRVASRTAETRDSATLHLEPVREPLSPFRPGQFTMLAVAGIGEVAISVSGDPVAQDGSLTHTIRAVGAVSTRAAPRTGGHPGRRPRAVRHDLGPAVGGRPRPADRGGRGRPRPTATGGPGRAGRAQLLPAHPAGRGRPHASRLPVRRRAGGLGRPGRHRR